MVLRTSWVPGMFAARASMLAKILRAAGCKFANTLFQRSGNPLWSGDRVDQSNPVGSPSTRSPPSEPGRRRLWGGKKSRSCEKASALLRRTCFFGKLAPLVFLETTTGGGFLWNLLVRICSLRGARERVCS